MKKHLFIGLAVVMTVSSFKVYAQAVGAGTGGGGEVVHIDGQLRFRDLQDGTVFECLPAPQTFISGNEKFQELMSAFSRVNAYAANIFEEEANTLNICFVEAPLRYINTEDRCAIYRTPRVRRSVMGVRWPGSNLLLVNRNLLNRLQRSIERTRSTRDDHDVASFFVHEVARSFIPYESEGNCHNNSDVRNFTGLIYRNFRTPLSAHRFNREMQIFNVHLPDLGFELQHSVIQDLMTLNNDEALLIDKLYAAHRLYILRRRFTPQDQELIETFFNPRYLRAGLVSSVIDNDHELAIAYAKLIQTSNTEITSFRVEGLHVLTYLIKQRNYALYRRLEPILAEGLNALTIINELIESSNGEALYLAITGHVLRLWPYSESANYADLLDGIFTTIKNDEELAQEHEFNNEEDVIIALARAEALNFNRNFYFYLVRKNYYRSIATLARQFGSELVDYVNDANEIGETLVTQSISSGNYQLFREIVRLEGFNPYHTRAYGDTYLHIAVSFSRVEMISMLKAHFPRLLSMRNGAGLTPLDLARRQQNQLAIDALR